MAVVPELDVGLLIRLALSVVTVLVFARLIVRAYRRGRRGRGPLATIPAPVFNLMVCVAVLRMLAMMAIFARIGLHAMHWGVQTEHLFATGVVVCIMAMFMPFMFTVMGTAVFRDNASP